MHPILLKLGPLTIYSYGVMLVIAFLTSAWLAQRATLRLPPAYRAIPPEQILDAFSAMLLGGILGGRLLYILLYWDMFRREPMEMLAIWHGGLVWYGGFLGGGLAGVLSLRAKRLDVLAAADQLAPFLALGHAIGRVGCFLNGCCYGKPTTSWGGVTFPSSATPVIPTQVIEALGLLFLYALLSALQRRSARGPKRQPGGVFGWYLVLYAVLRFLMEFLRGDQTPLWLELTLQQLISIGLFVLGWVLIVRSVPSVASLRSTSRRK